MSISAPSSSRAASKIFVSPRGLPLKIFVESTAVEDRRRLLKLLENNGAQLCTEVGDAQIILVDPISAAGRNYARSWGTEPGKVVLDVVWAHRCETKGRALLVDEGWGGCSDIDVTACSDDDGSGSDELSDSERKPQRKRKRSKERTSTSRKMQPVSAPVLPQSYSSVAGPPQPQEADRNIHAMNAAAQQIQRFLHPNYALFQQPQSIGNIAYLNSGAPVQFWPWQPLLSNAGVSAPFSQQPQHLIMPQHGADFNPLGSINAPSDSQSISQGPSTSAVDSAGAFSSAGLDDGRRESSPLSEEEIERDIQPSLRRRGRERKSNRVSEVKKEDLHSLSSRDGRLKDSRPVLQNDSEASSRASGSTPLMGILSRHPSTSTERVQPSSGSSEDNASGAIFIEENGEQMKFYVQTDLRERQQLLSMIKKNGGEVTSEMEVASYVILSSDERPHARKLLKTATVYGRTALKPHFIQACVKRGSLIDVEPYALNKVRGRSKQKKAKVEVKASSKRPTGKEGSGTKNRHCECRSLSPFTGTPKPSKNGVYHMYTPEEQEYAAKALRHLLAKDGYMTRDGFGEVLAARIPFHGYQSWLSTLKRDNYRAMMEREHRRHLDPKGYDTSDHEDTLVADDTDSIQRTSADSACTAVAGAGEVSSAMTSAETDETGFKTDFETIVDFFANKYWATDNKQEWDDILLWAELDAKHSCLTGSSWKVFYDTHQEAVDTKLREALSMQELSDVASNDGDDL